MTEGKKAETAKRGDGEGTRTRLRYTASDFAKASTGQDGVVSRRGKQKTDDGEQRAK